MDGVTPKTKMTAIFEQRTLVAGEVVIIVMAAIVMFCLLLCRDKFCHCLTLCGGERYIAARAYVYTGKSLSQHKEMTTAVEMDIDRPITSSAYISSWVKSCLSLIRNKLTNSSKHLSLDSALETVESA